MVVVGRSALSVVVIMVLVVRKLVGLAVVVGLTDPPVLSVVVVLPDGKGGDEDVELELGDTGAAEEVELLVTVTVLVTWRLLGQKLAKKVSYAGASVSRCNSLRVGFEMYI